jgi:hypothetical protein
MLRPVARLRRRILAGVLAALLAAPAVAVGSASAAQADAVRQQELWVLNAIHVAGAWQHTHGSGVTVALIDSGVNGHVPDLTGSVMTGRDFSGVSTPVSDPNWGIHGTWMASLIVGHGHATGGSSGIMGVAPAAKVLSIRAVTDQGDPGYRKYQHESESRVQGHLAAAIRYATSKNVGVISMSLGYQGASLPVREAISHALARGIVVIASSGNSGGSSNAQHGNAPYSFPADYPGVLGVGAVAQTGLPAGFSSDNLSVQVAAPGVRVPAQGRDGQYWLVSGTSPACALTAGVAALIKSVHPTLAPALVLQAITASTSNKPHGGYDEQVGFGTVDATAALTMAGRLTRGGGTGHGLVATAQFGGGAAAVPAVPVTPRGKSQLVTESIVALLCLAIVLVTAFRLILTRRAAVAARPAGPGAGPGPPWAGVPDAAGTGPGPPGYGTPTDHSAAAGYPAQPGYGTPADYRPAGGYQAQPGYGTPADHRSADGYQAQPGYGPPDGYGTPVSREPSGAYRPGGNHPPRPLVSPGGYGPPGGNGPPGTGSLDGQTSPGSYGSLPGYGPPDGRGSPAVSGPRDGRGSPVGSGSPGGRGSPAGSGPPDGRGSLDGPSSPGAHRPLDARGPLDRSQPPVADRAAVGYGPSARYGSPAGYGPAAESGPRPGDQPSPGHRRPEGIGAPGSFPDRASTGPRSAHQPIEAPSPPADPAKDPPPADDDTWPSSGQW